MKLKCIGGVFDGEWHYASDECKFGDSVRIANKPKSYDASVTYFPFTKEAMKAVTVDYIIYQIDCFHFSKDDIRYFLKPEGWTNKQALEYQFDK